MPRSKENSDELRRKVVEAHEAGKGYKTIAKVFDLHRSTVRQIIYKWKVFNTIATRPRSGRPTKLDTILRLMGGGAAGEGAAHSSDNEIDTSAEDACRSSEGEETARVSENEERRTGKQARRGGTAEEGGARMAGSESAAVAIDGASISANPLHPSDPKTMAKRRRGRKEKPRDSKLPRNHVLGTPLTPSSGDAPAPGPAEQHVEDMLCCDICGACFAAEPELETHQARHLYKMLHECEECGKAFQSAAGLKTHKKRKHGC